MTTTTGTQPTDAETTLIVGNIVTMSEGGPLTAEAMLVSDGVIVGVGSVADLERAAPAGSARHDITSHDITDGWIMPGLIEPHGHPSDASMLLGDAVVDIRPVIVADAAAVMQKIRDAIAQADPAVGLLEIGRAHV